MNGFRLIIAVVAVLGFAMLCQGGGKPGLGTYKEYKITGPFEYKNLSVFLVHGDDKIDAKHVLTLDEALEQKKIVVYETSDVDTLHVENKSKDSTVYIQSGDIVKGGKQDRVLRYDAIIPPKSGKIPIDSFCVEAGRWEKRGKENVANFTSSKKQLVSKKAKIAAKHGGTQQAVWDDVKTTQTNLNINMSTNVEAKESKTSLQLTLENKILKKETKKYVKKLKGIIKKRKDTIGFIFAINGEINSADIYAAKTIFEKLWPKAIESAAVEAIAELQKDKKTPVKKITMNEVVKWLGEVEKGKKSNKQINSYTLMNVNDSRENLSFETVDKTAKDGKKRWIHKNYIKKKKKK